MATNGPTVFRPTPRPPLVRSAMGGFFLLGSLMALLGALLPVWLQYIHFDLGTAGDYFLAFNLGTFTAAMASRDLLARLRIRRLLVVACFLTGGSLLSLAATFSPGGLIVPLIALGFAAGMLTTGVSWLMFDVMTEPRAASTLSLAGAFFGLGAFAFTLLIWATVHNLAASGILVMAAILPLALGVLYVLQRSLTEPALGAAPLRMPASDTRSPTAILLSLALFFQSGSEWAAGGWIALYWMRQLGVNLESALAGLLLYWLALTLGKLLGPRVPGLQSPLRLATASTTACLLGALFLLATTARGGAVVGTLLFSSGLGALSSLTIGLIAQRFRYYHPGFFNGFFSLSLIGGMLSPWLVGHLADAWSIEWAIRVPALGCLAVYVLLAVVLLEARLARMARTASSS
jgi:FHS family glucose/mannose:H+ symporter-like MFS transporter